MTDTIADLAPMSVAISLNESGEVVGWEKIAKPAGDRSIITTTVTNGVTWQGGTATIYGSPAGTSAPVIYLEAINNLGVMAGSENQNKVGQVPVLWQNGTATVLGLAGGDTNGLAIAINDFGIACGLSYGFDANGNFTTQHAVLWQSGGTTVLPPLAGDTGDSVAQAINDSGLVVGYSNNSALLADGSAVSHAVAWSGGAVAALATVSGELSSVAGSVNLAGQIVGTAQFAAGSDAMLWQNGSVKDLGALSGFAWTSATAINDLGQVVGTASTTDPNLSSSGTQHAFLWEKGAFTDLNTLLPANSGWVLQVAQSINDSGQIIGDGTLNGSAATFMLDIDSGSAASPAHGAVQAFQQGLLSAPVSLPDQAADVAANLDGLQGLAAAGKLGTILLIDSGVPVMTVTDAQLIDDAAAWQQISGSFLLSAPSASILRLSGTVSNYTVTVGSSGSVSVGGNGTTEQVPHAVALEFADHTEIVAQTPGTEAVTTGNITELYAAIFGREPDIAGLVYYQDDLAANPAIPLSTFAQWFLASPEYTGNSAHDYAATAAGDAQFITDTYNNLLHRGPAAGDVAWYQANVLAPILGNATPGTAAYAAVQTLAHAQLLVDFSASAEFLADVQVTAQHPADSRHWLVLT